MKKILSMALATVAGVALVCGAAACSTDPDRQSAENVAEAYSFSAGTAGILVSAMQGGSAAQNLSSRGFAVRETVTDETTIKELNNF